MSGKRNPEPKGYVPTDIETIRQLRHISIEAALWMLYRLRTHNTATGAWDSTIEEDAEMIGGASVSAVKRARQQLAKRDLIKLWETTNRRGIGADIVVVVANVPEGKMVEGAVCEHAAARGLRLHDAQSKPVGRVYAPDRSSASTPSRSRARPRARGVGRDLALAESGASTPSRSLEPCLEPSDKNPHHHPRDAYESNALETMGVVGDEINEALEGTGADLERRDRLVAAGAARQAARERNVRKPAGLKRTITTRLNLLWERWGPVVDSLDDATLVGALDAELEDPSARLTGLARVRAARVRMDEERASGTVDATSRRVGHAEPECTEPDQEAINP